MDLKNALDALAKLAIDGQAIRTAPTPGNEDRSYLLLNPNDGTIEEKAKPFKASIFQPFSPQDLAAFIAGIDPANDEFKPETDAAVVVSVRDATYYPDLDDRLRKVVCQLDTTDQFKWFVECSAEEHDQREFVKTLRITLGGCVPPSLLASVRNVSWNRSTSGTVVSNSLGKSVMDELKAESMPEEVSVSIPVFVGVPFNGQFRAYVEIDPSRQKFALIPEPQALAKITEQALRAIGSVFSELKGIQVIIGE